MAKTPALMARPARMEKTPALMVKMPVPMADSSTYGKDSSPYGKIPAPDKNSSALGESRAAVPWTTLCNGMLINHAFLFLLGLALWPI